MGQHWERDPKTGDYVLEGGKPKQTDSLRIPAFLRLKIERTGTLDGERRGWLYAPDSSYGSNFYQVRKNRSAGDNSFLEDVANSALRPLVADGRASLIENTVVAAQRHGAELQTKIPESKAKDEELVIDPLEV